MKKNSPTTIWVECLSIFSLPSVLKVALGNNGAIVRFMERSRIGSIAIKAVKALRIIPLEYERVRYSLSDMKIGKETMGMKLQLDLPKVSYEIVERLKKRDVYREIIKYLPEEKVHIFFEKKVNDEIYRIYSFLLVIYWNRIQGEGSDKNIAFFSYSPLLQELKAVWSESSISIAFYNDYRYRKMVLRNLIRYSYRKFIFFRNIAGCVKNFIVSKPTLAVHYAEGIDINTRSDIFWYSKSGIKPQRVLFYFDLNKRSPTPISKSVCDEIEKIGMGWLTLRKKAVSNYARDKAKRFYFNERLYKIPKIGSWLRSPLDRWTLMTGRQLLSDVELWKTFFKSLNIKIVFDVGAQTCEATAQNMALDLTDGIRIGIQRSTIIMFEYLPFLRYNGNHLFFVWGREAEMHRGTSKIVRNLIISGYPFDRALHKGPLINGRQNGRAKEGKRFVIALFDSTYAKDFYFSKDMMYRFYRVFLEWLMEDEEVFVIIKEKKPEFFDNLVELRDLIEKAESSGRYLRLKDALGRFPAEAAASADMAIGVGISSAATEGVIAGSKVIHCDLANHHFHPFYRWGYEKIIFDDIDRLASALKRYKADSANEPGLGDWSNYIDRLDPFRDRKGGERIGTYMRWLLEGFDRGEGRDEAIRYANRLYKLAWGEDKIVEMGHRNEAA